MRIAAAVAVLAMLAPTAMFAGRISADYPDGVLCPIPARDDRPEGVSVFYLSLILGDGRVLYQTTGNQVQSITFDASGAPVVGSGDICGGKSLSDLKATGMTF